MDSAYVKVEDGQRSQKCCSGRVRCCGICCGVSIVALILLFLLSFVILMGLNEFPPLHASCKIDWTFGIPCEEVNNDIVEQMKRWETNATCGTGQKCLYELTSSKEGEIIGTHETPRSHYIDDMTFTLTEAANGTCNVHGFSTSRVWYAVLDYGTNYCNLHNLIDGSGLVNVSGYSETTNGNICTQYSKRNCEKY